MRELYAWNVGSVAQKSESEQKMTSPLSDKVTDWNLERCMAEILCFGHKFWGDKGTLHNQQGSTGFAANDPFKLEIGSNLHKK